MALPDELVADCPPADQNLGDLSHANSECRAAGQEDDEVSETDVDFERDPCSGGKRTGNTHCKTSPRQDDQCKGHLGEGHVDQGNGMCGQWPVWVCAGCGHTVSRTVEDVNSGPAWLCNPCSREAQGRIKNGSDWFLCFWQKNLALDGGAAGNQLY